MSEARPAPRPPGDRGQGRRRFTPTEQQKRLVTLLRAAGTSPEAIARELNISASTLFAKFPDELAHGKAAVVARVGAKLIQRAMAGHFNSMAFYLARFGGDEWRQTSRHELSGPDGVPLTPPVLHVHFMDPIENDGPRFRLPHGSSETEGNGRGQAGPCVAGG